MIKRLVSYEIYKIISSAFIRVLVILLLLLNIVMCAYASYTPEQEWDKYLDAVFGIYYDDPQRFFSEYDRISKEYSKHDFMSGDAASAYGGGVVSDMDLFRSVYETVKTDSLYHDEINHIVKAAGGICSNCEKSGKTDTYIYRYNQKLIERYSYLYDNTELGDEPVCGWEEYFSYNADFFPAFLLITVVVVFMVTSDRSCGFYSIASTCENGRAKTAASKFFAALILSSAVTVIFTVITFAVCGIAAGGYSDPGNAAQAIDGLRHMPLRLSFAGAAALGLGLKLLSAAVYCSAVFAVTTVIKQNVLAIGAGIGIYVLNYAVSRVSAVTVGQYKYLNLWSVYYIDQYASRYRSVDLFGQPVELTLILIPAAVLLLVVSYAVSCVFYPRGDVLLRLRLPKKLSDAGSKIKQCISRLCRRTVERADLSLTFYELYKQRIMLLLLVAVIIIKVIASADYYKSNDTVYDAAYKKYLAEVGGVYTEAKTEYLQKKLSSCKKIIEEFDTIERDWWHGELSDERYNDLFTEYMRAQSDADALAYLVDRAEYLGGLYESRGKLGSFVYDIGYYKYMSQGTDWLLLLFVSLLSCRAYLCEYTKTPSGASMPALSNVTELGRGPLFRRKAGLCIMSSAVAWYIFRMIDLFFLLRSYEMPDMTASVLSMPRYNGALFNLTISGYILISTFIGLFGVLLISSLCFSMGFLFKRAIFVYPAVAVILTVPYLASLTGITAAGCFDLSAFCDADRLYRLSPASLPMPVYCIGFGAVIICAAITTFIYSARKVEKGDIS